MTASVLRFNAPATYRIRAQGNLDASGLHGLEGLTLTKEIRAGQAPQITLSGRFADQGTLIRLLDDLLDRDLELLSVEYLATESVAEAPACSD